MLVQALWLIIIVIVPLALMMLRRSHLLLAWICLATCVDIFKALNVSATTVAGLLLIPYTIKILVCTLRTRPSQLLVAQYGHLMLLGLVFGFLFPWPDTLHRPFSLQASGRTILYMTRQIANLSIAFFVARQIVRSKHPGKLFRYILAGTLLAAIGALAEYLTGISLYTLLTEGILSPTYHNLRVRGFSFEPRGLGLTLAYGILLCLLLSLRHRSWKVLALLLVNVCALLLSRSVSGLMAVAAGTLSLFVFYRRARWVLSGLIVGAVCVVLVSTMLKLDWVTLWGAQLTERIGSTIRFGQATNWFEDVVFRVEVFDAVALLFLASNPIYIFLGTGPGLIQIPDTPFLPVSPYYEEVFRLTGVQSPPTMGWLLELSNAGLIGVLLWLAFFVLCLGAINRLIKHSAFEREQWEIARSAFVGAAAMYLVAAGFLSSFWPLFMGVGLAAVYLQRTYRQQQEKVRPKYAT
jgi:hypothetical protein